MKKHYLRFLCCAARGSCRGGGFAGKKGPPPAAASLVFADRLLSAAMVAFGSTKSLAVRGSQC
jgi:hypothetical protein